MEQKKFQIIVVDDEPKITKLQKLILEESLNCEVETFNSSSEALKRLQQKSFDAISLDHRMPELTGMDLVKLLRMSPGPNKATRIILLTGYREEAECVHTDLLDEVIFLDKPIDDKRYLRWIKVLLNPKLVA